jgi:hypothetical protein
MPILTSPPLRPAVHDLKSRAWCGLVVLSAITRAPTSEVRAVIQAFRGSTGPVKGVTVDEMRWVLYQHLFRPGQEAWFDQDDDAPTLADWLGARTADERRQTFVVMLNLVRARRYRGARMNLHWAAVDAHTFVDTHTKGRPVPHRKAPHLREPVMAVFPVWKEPAPGGTCSTADGRPVPSLESCV